MGLKSSSCTIARLDAAGEILKAVIEKNWLPESSVPARFPHNSVLEREIKRFQEIARSLFLQAGFAARPQLWLQACSYVATATSAFLRWEVAFGNEFPGPHYLLGQLGYVRTKDADGEFLVVVFAEDLVLECPAPSDLDEPYGAESPIKILPDVLFT